MKQYEKLMNNPNMIEVKAFCKIVKELHGLEKATKKAKEAKEAKVFLNDYLNFVNSRYGTWLEYYNKMHKNDIF